MLIVKLFLGEIDITFDIVILIFILVQLILYDEMGLKHQKLNEFEDTSTAFVRMNLNKIVNVRMNNDYEESINYLKAKER